VAAAGRANATFNPDTAQLVIARGEQPSEKNPSLLLFKDGLPTRYSEQEATVIFKEANVYVGLDLGLGQGSATIWTCDLSHEYVSINGDYRS
jgi:glutamate N-acetyltransferase/amino-acid N-acetyltransferase